jgi:ATP-dependent RNA helicase SUPV3L1/SUV3
LELIEGFAKLTGDDLPSILTKISQMATVTKLFKLCNAQDLLQLSLHLNPLKLNINDLWTFVQSPVKSRDEEELSLLFMCAQGHSKGTPVGIAEALDLRPGSLKKLPLTTLEVKHRHLMIYLWLGIRFPESFPESDRGSLEKVKLESEIQERLMRVSYSKKKRHCKS